MNRKLASQISELISMIFGQKNFIVESDKLKNFIIAIEMRVTKAAGLTIESGLEEEDFLTPIWLGLNDAFRGNENDEISLSYIARCVQNKIHDTCRNVLSKSNIPLNSGLQTKLLTSRRLAARNAMNDGADEDTFDNQTKELAKLSFDENEYYQITLTYLIEEFQQQKSKIAKGVISGWSHGFSKTEIAKYVNISVKHVSRIIDQYLEAARKRIKKHFESENIDIFSK